MTSNKRKYVYEGLPGFDIDPVTGKYFPVPVDFKAVFGSPNALKPNPAWIKSTTKPDGNYPSQPVKYRKNETGVRKELFKIPTGDNQYQQTNQTWKYSRTGTPYGGLKKSFSKTLPSTSATSNIPMKKTSEKKKVSPLKSKSKGQLSNKGKAQQPTTPQLRVLDKGSNEPLSEKTPDMNESNINEFLKLEQFYKTPKVTTASEDSPVSSVCNMFESKMLLDSCKDIRLMSKSKITAKIRTLLDLNKKMMMEQQMKLEANHRLILNLVEQLEESEKENGADEDDEEKENSSRRRSLRLQQQQQKSPSVNENRSSMPVGSPIILKSGDLRKSTLNKSLVSKCNKYQIECPRVQKALDMYNSTRSACSALLTPKLSRGQLVDSPSTTSRLRALSMKVQQQCLMLQDTPQHKK